MNPVEFIHFLGVYYFDVELWVEFFSRFRCLLIFIVETE